MDESTEHIVDARAVPTFEALRTVIERRHWAVVGDASRHLRLTFRTSGADDDGRAPARCAVLDMGFDHSKLVTVGLNHSVATALFAQVDDRLHAEPWRHRAHAAGKRPPGVSADLRPTDG